MYPKIKSMAVAGAVALAGATWLPAADVPPPSEFQDLVQAYREQRADFLEARRQLRLQLAGATSEEQRRQILRDFLELHRERILMQRELRREFRRQHLDIRRQRRLRSAVGS